MSVTMIAPIPKRSTGFTIDSIIGNTVTNNKKDSNSSDEKEFHSGRQFPKNTNDVRIPSPEERCEASLREEMHRHGRDNEYSDRSNRINAFMDPLKHLQGQSQESLKHLHEVLAQTAGATGTYIPTPRVCRHPLSALNVHSMYSAQHLPQSSPLHPLVINPASRDIRALHPYLAERYSAYYYPRFPTAGAPGFMFQPYRKPKRIRTAFSPSQLLQLEKAFEKSHYVVGQERKDLASDLQLTETQVKVWFQNRRTKHKRIRSEDGSSDHEGDSSHNMSHDMDSDVSDDVDVSDDEICVMSHQ